MTELLSQSSDEWLYEHSIRCTASRFKDVMKGAKGKFLAARQKYAIEIAAVRLTGVIKQLNGIAAIEHGIEYENEARNTYEFISGNTVEQSGLITLPENDMVGCSPDGLIDDDGGVEIKCFDTKRHIEIVFNGLPKEVIPQVQGCMWVTGRKWWDFVSYDPRIQGSKNIYIQRIERNDKYIKSLSEDVLSFVDEVKKITEHFL